MLFLASLLSIQARADSPLPANPLPTLADDDLLDGRRFTNARYLDLPSGKGTDGRRLPEGTTPRPLHTESLDHAPAHDLRGLVSLVPGMVRTRHGVAFSDGSTIALYVDGLRWDRSGLVGR
ncbi:MAG: hypothetical protein Q8P18_00310 [Pseudomonadota bacterium]|nr:hypothetical protein [Pseudomonadota bacterium]